MDWLKQHIIETEESDEGKDLCNCIVPKRPGIPGDALALETSYA